MPLKLKYFTWGKTWAIQNTQIHKTKLQIKTKLNLIIGHMVLNFIFYFLFLSSFYCFVFEMFPYWVPISFVEFHFVQINSIQLIHFGINNQSLWTILVSYYKMIVFVIVTNLFNYILRVGNWKKKKYLMIIVIGNYVTLMIALGSVSRRFLGL